MDLFKAYGTNKQAENDGVWILFEDVGFLCRRLTVEDPRFRKVTEAKTKPYRQAIRTETISSELLRRINVEVFVEACLLDWKNVNGKDGNPLEFNKENAIWLFLQLPDLFSLVSEEAGRIRNFQTPDEVEEDTKN